MIVKGNSIAASNPKTKGSRASNACVHARTSSLFHFCCNSPASVPQSLWVQGTRRADTPSIARPPLDADVSRVSKRRLNALDEC